MVLVILFCTLGFIQNSVLTTAELSRLLLIPSDKSIRIWWEQSSTWNHWNKIPISYINKIGIILDEKTIDASIMVKLNVKDA